MLSLTPIGYVRTGKSLKFEAGHQPDPESGEVNQVVLEPGRQFELALQDLAGFDRIWLIWWFHQNSTWRPRALPPRGPAKRRGVFATRSPHRPNPIGLTCVRLLRVQGLTLEVGPLDLLDGTPILDIKPYLSTVDAFPESSLGWVQEVEEYEATSRPRYEIELAPLASSQLLWLKEEWSIDFTERAFGLLRRDPTPHRTRRILRLQDGRLRMACGPWRLFFRVEGDQITVEEIGVGYSEEALIGPSSHSIPDHEALAAFRAKFSPGS
ncbi:MAG: tRNA (N6-threonylcarbamoyladenosine(37)-N6)-methyltransferase TrmO [Armatimonadetes bacterium]|nr:tRNA (N6-threonylcarbamoyladenosine(37)-N6)-methyltransferase TrmO [Armatimonadota bacterium]